MIDIHSHVLPCIDDGSKSVEESIRMLKASAAQGIGEIVATPHFYPDEDSPDRFLRRRNAAADRLLSVRQDGSSKLRLGAEVYYFEGISMTDGIEELRISGTELLLLEMPFGSWSGRMIKDIRELNRRRGLTVLLAHIERYMHYQSSRVWDELLDSQVLMQSNADFFLKWNTRQKALRMLRSGRIHFIGSDCHNMNSRPPLIGEALRKMQPSDRRLLRDNIDRFFQTR